MGTEDPKFVIHMPTEEPRMKDVLDLADTVARQLKARKAAGEPLELHLSRAEYDLLMELFPAGSRVRSRSFGDPDDDDDARDLRPELRSLYDFMLGVPVYVEGENDGPGPLPAR